MAFKKIGNQSPDIIVTFKFETATSVASFSRFADYTSREEAVLENQAEKAFEEHLDGTGYEQMISYMKRDTAIVNSDERRTGIFNHESVNMSVDGLEKLKGKLEKAQLHGCNLWNSAISFDVAYLIKIGALEYNPKLEALIDQADRNKKAAEKEEPKNPQKIYQTKKRLENLAKQRVVNQEQLKAVVQKNMPSFLKSEGFGSEAFWWGSVHLNTKHIHLHVSVSETQNSRKRVENPLTGLSEPRGKLKVRNMNRLKSNLYHDLDIDEHKKVRIMREVEVAEIKTKIEEGMEASLKNSRQPLLEFYLQNVYERLPKDGKWRYGSNRADFKEAKVFISAFIDHYLNVENKEAYESFKNATQEQLKEYEHSYSSEGKLNLHDAVLKREALLKERLGNQILKALKEHPLSIDQKDGKTQDFLSTKDWMSVVDDLKNSKLSKKEVGLYRLALKQSEAQADEIFTKVQLKKLGDFEKVESNYLLKEFLEQKFKEKIELAQHVQSGGMSLSEGEKSKFQNLKTKYLSARDVPIKQASTPFIIKKVQLLETEKQILTQTKDKDIIKAFYGSPKREAVKFLEQELKILELKQKIFENNQNNHRKENKVLFTELKKIYGESEPANNSKKWERKLSDFVSKEFQDTPPNSNSHRTSFKLPRIPRLNRGGNSSQQFNQIMRSIRLGESEARRAARIKRRGDREEDDERGR